MPNFSDVLLLLRKEKGMTQQELADILTRTGEAKITRSAVGMWESGKRVPKTEVLETIADFFNVDMNYLLGHSPSKMEYSEMSDDPHEIRMIARAGKRMTPEKRQQMLEVLKTIFPEEFKDDEP